MFSKDFCKWAWITGIYQHHVMLCFKQAIPVPGREMFLTNLTMVLITINDIGDLLMMGRSVTFPNTPQPPPQTNNKLRLIKS